MTVKESPFKNMLETDHANVKIHAILIPNRASDLFIYLFLSMSVHLCESSVEYMLDEKLFLTRISSLH